MCIVSRVFFKNKNLFKTYLYYISIVKFKFLNCIKQFVLYLSFFVIISKIWSTKKLKLNFCLVICHSS